MDTHDFPPAGDEAAPAEAGGIDRRGFLASAGALLVGASLALSDREALAAGAGGAVGAYVRIGADETVTVLIGSSEMGQGIMTGLSQLVADELVVPWSRVRAEHAPAAAAYANPLFRMQLTGGSTTMRGWYLPLRKAAAAAREMLLAAGAAALGKPVSACTVANGKVWVIGTTRSVTYGQVAAAAGRLTPPTDPALRPAAKLQYIGRRMKRLDVPAKVTGKAVYGIDVRLPGMVYAAVKHAPQLGGKLAAVPARPAGSIAVVGLGNAVAVVSTDTWKAQRFLQEMPIRWTAPPVPADVDSAAIAAKAAALLASGPAVNAETVGNAAAGYAAASKRIDATYSLPYLAHACMEPLNCTARVTPDLCEIWAPTQGQGLAVFTAQAVTGLPADKIVVHTTFLGGGLGRKFEQDFIRQAVTVAKAVGKPVKLTWFRGEDFANDQYRPMALVRVRAGVNAAGDVTGWMVRSTSPSIAAQRRPNFTGVDASAVEGSVELGYAFKARRTDWVRHPAAVPVGYWRSVGHSINAFAVESAIDELAAAAGQNPLAFRRKLLAGDPRGLAVLDAAAALGAFSSSPPAGRARGIAYHESFGSRVATVLEVSAPATGGIRVHKAAVAIDCGTVVNPEQVEAQMESAVVHGLTAALWSEMTFVAGRVLQRNFHAYKMLRMAEMPVVSVKVIAGGDPLGGVGEPGVPPVAPALANAYARLTGRRVRTLPFFPGTFGGEDG
jgi:isoquinoline 1-oxidoreductase beta subunit